jgi:hypothetical protein
MLYDVVERTGAASAAELRSAIDRELRRVVEAAGADSAATAADTDSAATAADTDSAATAADTDSAATAADTDRVATAADTDRVATAAGVPAEVVAAAAAGDSGRLTLEQAAALLAVDPDAPDADAIVAETRDHLLLGMTTGVVDVDTLADDVDADLTGQELQQVIEGRAPMTLDQFVAIQRAIAARNDR